MLLGDRLGVAGLIVAFLAIAAFYLWPEKRWIGWICLGAAIALILYWAWIEFQPQMFGFYGIHPIGSTLIVAICGGALTGILWLFVMTRATKPPPEVGEPSAPQPLPSSRRLNDIHPVEPRVEVSVGMPFGSLSLITIKNAGIEPLTEVRAHLRFFALQDRPDPTTDFMEFAGFESIEHDRSWWKVGTLAPGQPTTREAYDDIVRFWHNKKIIEASSTRIYREGLLAVDVLYQRESDHKLYCQTAIALVLEDGQKGTPFLEPPLSITEEYVRLVEKPHPAERIRRACTDQNPILVKR